MNHVYLGVSSEYNRFQHEQNIDITTDVGNMQA